jgi:hypothetical protein
VRRQVAALAVVVFAVHLLFLPPTLEDIDSINFALGVREFDVANHQPHPPGYPVYVALARVSAAAAAAWDADDPVLTGLALVSVISGALLVPVLYGLFRQLDPRLGWWAALATTCSPLVWFTAARPLSDMAGLTAALATQVLCIAAIRGVRVDDGRRHHLSPAFLVSAAAMLAGLAAGIRSQTVMLTAPLLLAALAWPRTGLAWRDRAVAVCLAGAAVVLWAVPLVIASGGLGDYFVALGAQGGEDFRGVVMLWTSPHPRVALEALRNTFVLPWGGLVPGLLIMTLALAGAVVAARRAPALLVLLAVAFGPYAAFHLLFHETATLRYALPLVPPVVFLMLYTVAGAGRAGPAVAGGAVAALSLVWTVPALHAYARTGSPAFQVLDAALAADRTGGRTGPLPVVGMHAVMHRVEEWRRPEHARRVLRAGHGKEWLALVDHWKADPVSSVQFLADPRRTDLALFDARDRERLLSARWSFPEVPFVAGARPGGADFYLMRPPGWMLDRGWALTAEVGGVTSASGLGPHVEPTVAWVRARTEPGTLLIGGRHLGPGAGMVRVTVDVDSCELTAFDIGPGSFTRLVTVPADVLRGEGYRPLAVRAAAADGSPTPGVSLEQFDLQAEGVPMMGFFDGWHEPEYQPVTARAWRWMSEHAAVWVRPVGRDVTLTIAGESPRRYFERSPDVRVVAAGIELARLRPDDDFAVDIPIPAGVLDAAGGMVTIESDLWFSPADREASADRRHLALRIYEVSVR